MYGIWWRMFNQLLKMDYPVSEIIGYLKVEYFPNPAITIASFDCVCHCEVASTVAISSEKARLLRFTRNDNSYSWIWVFIFCHSRLSGILPNCSESKERFWTSQNDRNKELRQRPQGVKFIKFIKSLLPSSLRVDPDLFQREDL